MRTSRSRSIGLATAIALVALSGWSGCGRFRDQGASFPLRVGSENPAAQGEVNVKNDGKGNAEVVVKVEHLAPPDLAVSGARTYVVWFQPHDSKVAKNMGNLQVDKNRRAEFKTKTPFDRFDVFVTAEPDPMVLQPTGSRVLRAEVLPTTKRGTF